MSSESNEYRKLLDFCISDKQRNACIALAEENTQAKAAKRLGVNKRSLERMLKGIRHQAAQCGYAPESQLVHRVPEGFGIKGLSQYINDEGVVTGQWVKADRKKIDELQSFMDAVENIVEVAEGKAEPKKISHVCDDDLMVKYPIADAHLGLLTWRKEVGKDFDLEIAGQLFRDGFKMAVDASPSASTALILDLGDTIHTDDSTNQTKASKHNLDVDGRFDKVYDTALIILINMIDLALEKHETVIFRKTRGNHDPDMSIAISAFIAAYYRNEPRLKVERSPSLFWWYQFGSTLHFSTHGHTVKHGELPEIMAHDCEDIWSQTKHRYIDTGHIHHQNIKECRTCIMESHNSMAAGDSYNFGHGYRSKRNLKAIVYHKDYGEIQRNIIDIGRII